jgi:hypothetical protein
MATQGTNTGRAASEMRRKMKKAEFSPSRNRTSYLIQLVFWIGLLDRFSLE